MRFGLVGSSGSASQAVRLAQEAETHGWDGFFTWDGLSIGAMDTWDAWTLLGALAVATERIRLGAMVFAPARRRPWTTARAAVTVDHLSGGRLVLPVGVGAGDDGGFTRVAGEAVTLRERAERLDEALTILDRAWTGEPFSFTGRHHSVTDLLLLPRPVQRPRIPVWPVGVWPSERSMARAARWDGVVLQGRGGADVTPGDVRDVVRWVEDRRRAVPEGRPAAVGDVAGERHPGPHAGEAPGGDRSPAPFDVVVQGELPTDRRAAEDRARAYADAGATWWVESRWDPVGGSPEALLDLARGGPPRLAGG